MNKLYSVAVSGKNNLIVFDVIKGTRSYSINLGNVQIINGPIVTSDKLTVVVKNSQNKTIGKVYSLKTGVLSYSFTIQ
jgi:hypothetical protein